MTQDEIIEMAREAGFEDFDVWAKHHPQETKRWCERMQAFANLVAAKVINSTWTQEQWTEYENTIAAKEREACANVCEETTASWTQVVYNGACMDCAIAIRARGEA